MMRFVAPLLCVSVAVSLPACRIKFYTAHESDRADKGLETFWDMSSEEAAQSKGGWCLPVSEGGSFWSDCDELIALYRSTDCSGTKLWGYEFNDCIGNFFEGPPYMMYTVKKIEAREGAGEEDGKKEKEAATQFLA
mmetsp:Transcript_20547/g.41076  ORF Transcript_20547/g.41076 Transcript_20547/m.41076 type:complete len:136 (+) Transcript_20547:95-502(+)